jgi:hypothetical protein
MVSPFARLNLYRNPFGELTSDERAELAVVDARRWTQLLDDPKTAVQFVGSAGHGKTTHLLAIAGSLPGAAYIYLPPAGPQPRIPRRRPLLIDEAQRLTPWQRRRVFARGGPLALGTHEDLSGALRRAGLEVVTVDVGADRSPEQLMQILNRRIEASRATDAPLVHIDLPQAIELRHEFGGDIREIEQHLYHQFQQHSLGESPWPTAS